MKVKSAQNFDHSNVYHCQTPPLKQLWKRTKEHACMFVNLMINDSTSRSVNILEDWNIAWGRKTSSTILHHQHETHAYFQKTKCKHIASTAEQYSKLQKKRARNSVPKCPCKLLQPADRPMAGSSSLEGHFGTGLRARFSSAWSNVECGAPYLESVLAMFSTNFFFRT